MISKGNQVKFVLFVLLSVSEEAKTGLPFFFHSMCNKTVNIRFGFSNIQNDQGRERVASPSLQLQLITHPTILVFLDTTKTSSNNCLLAAYKEFHDSDIYVVV